MFAGREVFSPPHMSPEKIIGLSFAAAAAKLCEAFAHDETGPSRKGKGRFSVCCVFYGTMRVPLSPRMAAGACSSEAMTARRRQPLRTNCTAAATFGCMEPAPNCPARR